MMRLTGWRYSLLSLGSAAILVTGACSVEEVDSDTHSNADAGRPASGGASANAGAAGEDEGSGGTDRDGAGGAAGAPVAGTPNSAEAGGPSSAPGGAAGSPNSAEAGGPSTSPGGAAGTPNSAGALNAGAGGASAGAAGAEGGTAGVGAGAGGQGTACFGDETTLTELPATLCAQLPYAATPCPTGDYGGSLAMQRCIYFAQNARPGVFEALYGCLQDIEGDVCSEDAENAADDCVWMAMSGACRDVLIYPDYPDTTCEWLVAGDPDPASVENPYEGCSDIVPDGTTEEAIAACDATFSAFNEEGRAQIYDCYACQVVAEDLTCGEQFEECALPDVPVISVTPYPYDPEPGTCE